jgi:hypothetical protein
MPKWVLPYFLKIHLLHFSKIKSHKEVTKQKESMFFFLFLFDDRRIQEAQKHMDPMEPDTQYRVLLKTLFETNSIPAKT